jgi:hypothetical protein
MSELSGKSKIESGLLKAGQIVKRIPFTLVMVLLLLLVAWGTHSYFQELVLRRAIFGFYAGNGCSCLCL